MDKDSKEELTLYVTNTNGYALKLQAATLSDILDAVELARKTDGILTYAPDQSKVSVIQLLDFCDGECKVYVVLDEDECVGKETRLPIDDAIELIKSIRAGATPARAEWQDLFNR